MSNTDLMNHLKKIQNALVMRTFRAVPKGDPEAMEAFEGWKHASDLLWTHRHNPLLDQAVKANLDNLLEILKKRGIASF